jgi:hypothetical protein
MSYFFYDRDRSHREVLAEILHRIRWDPQFPDTYEGLSWNRLMETAVDAILSEDIPSRSTVEEILEDAEAHADRFEREFTDTEVQWIDEPRGEP